MTAEEAMKQISKLLDEYIDGDVRELTTLSRIAFVTGQYEYKKTGEQ